MHTELVRKANQSSKSNYARTVRLLKHWSRTHSRPLCSWNIKALGLPCLGTELDQLNGMVAWFNHAIMELASRPTPDPAGVAGPIGLPGDRMELVEKLTKARSKLFEAINYAADGYLVLAVEALATFFDDPDMLPHPDAAAVCGQQLRRAEDLRKARPTRRTPVTAPQVRQRTPVRSWAP